MWMIILRDLQFRRRQFAIAVVGAGVAFALALVLTGMSAGFRHEAEETVEAIGAGAWIVPRGVSSPFTSQSTMPAKTAGGIAGGGQAEPLVEFGHVARSADGEEINVNVMGHSIGELGDPAWGEGEISLPTREAVVDERLGVDEGDMVTIASRSFRVAEVVSDRTYFAGQPSVFVSLDEAQAIAFGGRPLASAILTTKPPRHVPRGFTAITSDDVREDLLESMEGAIGSIDITRLLTWLLAVVVIGAVTYLSALERLRDFAVLTAVGGSQRRLVLGLSAQAVLASLLAVLLGAIVAQALAPAFPLPVVIEPGAYAALPIVAVVIGILASLAAMRRALRVDPALAFSGT